MRRSGHVSRDTSGSASRAENRRALASPRGAAQRGCRYAQVIAELQAAGATSLRAIASGLNERRIPTARGLAWSATQVARVMARQPAI